MPTREINQAIIELIKKNRIDACYIRPLVYRGYKEMGLNPRGCPVDVAIIVWPWGKYVSDGMSVAVSSWRRIPECCLPMKAKACGQYIGSQLAKIEALDKGFDEAIMLDVNGFVVEGSAENIYLVKDETIITPSVNSCILEGITRASVLEIAKEELGYEVIERDIPKDELYSCDEAFFTGTAAEVASISKIDNHVVGEGKKGKVTESIQNKFYDVVSGKDSKYSKWLTLVD